MFIHSAMFWLRKDLTPAERAQHDHYQTACPLHAHFVATCHTHWDRVVVHDLAPLD